MSHRCEHTLREGLTWVFWVITHMVHILYKIPQDKTLPPKRRKCKRERMVTQHLETNSADRVYLLL